MSTRAERYEVIATIQDGQFATSYKARDRVLDRLVLLKVLHPEQAIDVDLVQRFRREALLQARLKHPNIVTVYDFGSADDFYIASEYVEGVALDRLLSDKHRLSLKELTPIIRDVCRALDYAHKQGVVHRDLKPANIIITPDGHAKLTDFGLAFCRDLGPITQEGCIVGTPAYMSPEQTRGQRTDYRTDIFSLGIVIYEALTGTNPFAAPSFADSMSLVLGFEPKPLAEVLPGLPVGLSDTVELMLAKNPADRPQDLTGLCSALDLTTSGSSLRPLLSSVLVPALILLALAATEAALLPLKPRGSLQPVAPLPSQNAAWSQVAVSVEDVPATDSSVFPIENQGPRIQNNVPDAAPRFCWVRINVSPWADVSIDELPVGTTPIPRPFKLTHGRHTIQLTNPYYPTLTKVIQLTDSACTLIFDLEKEFAFLDVRVLPWAVLAIDGQFVDTTPLGRPVPVDLGTHTLTLAHPELGSVTKTVITDTAGLYRLIFDLTQTK